MLYSNAAFQGKSTYGVTCWGGLTERLKPILDLQ
uniref:Uncharacterized protein n=1 Tax=Anguilla anguilla TaxID=7936 RepID=A0A0E9SX51_ANGAN